MLSRAPLFRRPVGLRKPRLTLGAGILLLGLVLVTNQVWLQWIGNALLLREEPRSADAVVVLGGDARGGRFDKGVELVRTGYAPRVYVLDDMACVRGTCIRWSDAWRATIDRTAPPFLGPAPHGEVPSQAVIPLLDDLPIQDGTFEEAVAAWARLELAGVHRILLVTSESHSRRATLTWRKVVEGRAEVISVPCSPNCDSVDHWWGHRRSVVAVWLEIPKMFFYAVSGRLSF